jgi:uncharacterized protein YsxB (DUF464 family)
VCVCVCVCACVRACVCVCVSSLKKELRQKKKQKLVKLGFRSFCVSVCIKFEERASPDKEAITY